MRYLLLIFSGLLILGAVFIYAQTRRDEVRLLTFADLNKGNGRILSGQTNSRSVPAPEPLAFQLTIDKPTVNLYWPQKITIQTEPNAEVRLRTTYPNGSINNNGTTTGTADRNGRFIVKWNLNGRDITGTATVLATVTVGVKQGTSEGKFDIVKPSATVNSTDTGSTPTNASLP